MGSPHTDTVGVLISLEAEEMLKSKLLQTTYFVVSPEGQRVSVIQLGLQECSYTCVACLLTVVVALNTKHALAV